MSQAPIIRYLTQKLANHSSSWILLIYIYIISNSSLTMTWYIFKPSWVLNLCFKSSQAQPFIYSTRLHPSLVTTEMRNPSLLVGRGLSQERIVDVWYTIVITITLDTIQCFYDRKQGHERPTWVLMIRPAHTTHLWEMEGRRWLHGSREIIAWRSDRDNL